MAVVELILSVQVHRAAGSVENALQRSSTTDPSSDGSDKTNGGVAAHQLTSMEKAS